MSFQTPVFISGPTIIPEELRRAPNVLVKEALENVFARATHIAQSGRELISDWGMK